MKATRLLTALPLLLAGITAQAGQAHEPVNPAQKTTFWQAQTPEKVDRTYADLDQDGVPDMIDLCPNSVHPDQVDELGCVGDQDGDGINDRLDQCPNTPKGRKVDSHGCQLDSDHDGVADADDRCPATPAGQKVNRYGCTPQSRAVLRLTFPTAGFTLTQAQQKQVDDALYRLKDRDENTALLVEGHTDAVGCRDDNLRLSWNRAEAVRAEIERVLGDKAENLFIIGYGESRPVADNATRSGRAQNRRIVLKVVPMDKLPSEASPALPQEMHGYTPHPGRCPKPDDK
ncbi:OmpA family protein [Sulfurivirga sp.]|uniref:OmpA family protein n=1 Tax=Sulfurivirga sp. TaxID=2614236 RepID=UPI0025D4F9C7|nr:OmpA family protein [Sulfurivirga sp.]